MTKIQCSGCAHALLLTSTNPVTVCCALRCHHPLCPSSALLGPDTTYSSCHAFPPSNTRFSPPDNPPALKPNGPTTIPLLPTTRLHPKTYYLLFFPFTPGSGCPLTCLLLLACDHNPLPPPQTSLPSLTCLMSFPTSPGQTPVAMAPLVTSPNTRHSLPPSTPGQVPPRRPGIHPIPRPGSPLSDTPPALVLSGQAPR